MFDESIINDEPIDLNAIIPKNQIIDEQIDINKPEETPKKRKGRTPKNK